mmetsp:Transcript_837/g.1378  ORF Transcript_837/g.1378 Transcript_837/m.1378 type:complete len:220 (-) Transcript_837:210-869(-)
MMSGLLILACPHTAIPSLPLIILRGGHAVVQNPGFSGTLQAYTAALTDRPVLTKSLTSGIVFGFSDICAQAITDGYAWHWRRAAVAALVGLCYFGPAAHVWYELMDATLPGRDIFPTLVKTALGQIIFGPTFTCVFFAASLSALKGLQGLQKLPAKIRQDLLPTLLAGMGYWPFVDFVSFGYVPIMWIPLFVNGCSFVWTIFLSMQAARGTRAKSREAT